MSTENGTPNADAESPASQSSTANELPAAKMKQAEEKAPTQRESWSQRLFHLLHSVRLRLSLWFGLVLAVILLLFSAFVYYRQTQDVRETAITRLLYRQRDLYGSMMAAGREADEEHWPYYSSEFTFELEDQEVLLISDSQGELSGVWGKLEETQAVQIAAQVNNLPYDRETVRAISVQLNGRPDYLFLPTPIVYDGRLLGWMVLGQPTDPQGQLPRLVFTLALGASFTLLIALAGGFWLADRALWPVKAITRTAQEIGETDLSRRLNLHTHDELGELAGTFDNMLDRLQAAFIRQRQFTADASHELRTPLTIIGLETSRALSSGRSGEDYRRAMRVIQSENEFMTRLVGELLLLARMDAGQVKLKREALDLSDMALDAIERFAPLAAHKGVTLEAGELPELPIQGDRQYLGQMISNLVDNAIKYSAPAGVVSASQARQDGVSPASAHVIVETLRCPDGATCLRVIDNGPGIPAEHLPHLFDRFYRVDTARSHNPDDVSGEADQQAIPGSGLGLSIVQWIAQMHGGSVTVESEAGKGSTFSVKLF